MKTFLLDASALIAEPSLEPDSKLITTPEILKELKSLETKNIALHALMTDVLEAVWPKQEFLDKIDVLCIQKGFDKKLSSQDKGLIALALQLKEQGRDFIVLTDDYSIQNLLAILGIKFEPILDKGIEKILEFTLECFACGKKYDFQKDKTLKECLHCGSKLQKKPVFRKITNKD